MALQKNVTLKSITEDQIVKAFGKTREQYETPGVKLVLITEEYYEKALGLCRDYFVPEEPINRACGLEYTEELKDMWLEALKMHFSLMFIDENTGDPIAFRTTNIVSRDEKLNPNAFKTKAMREVFTFLTFCDAEADFFNHYGTDEAFNFLGLVVSNKYQRRGFATRMFRAAVDMIRNLGLEEAYIKGAGTSNFSKKIYEKEGFDIVYEKLYDDYEVDGNHPIQNTGEHKSMKVYGFKVKQVTQ